MIKENIVLCEVMHLLWRGNQGFEAAPVVQVISGDHRGDAPRNGRGFLILLAYPNY